jgi:hypothetical protein
MSYNVNQHDATEFDVLPIKGFAFGYGKRSYNVHATLEFETYKCECCKFSRDGLLCCHILRVMVQQGDIDHIPKHYILRKWREPEEEVMLQKMNCQMCHPTGK